MFARPALALAAVVWAAGCSSPADEPAAPRAETEAAEAGGLGRYGLLVMTHDHGERGVSVSGQFAAWTDQRRAEVLHALALPDMAWLVSAVPPTGRCRSVTAPRQRVADGAAGHIELLSIGELTVAAPPQADAPATAPFEVLRLAPRPFPRVLFSLGGVAYDADDPDALPFVPHGRYRVRAPGDELGALSAEVAAPGEVRLLGTAVDESGLEVRWQGAQDAVLTLSRASGADTWGIQCRAPAGGRMVVPAERLAEFGPGEASLSVGEITRRPVAVAGLATVDLFFVSRDLAVVQIPASPANE